MCACACACVHLFVVRAHVRMCMCLCCVHYASVTLRVRVCASTCSKDEKFQTVDHKFHEMSNHIEVARHFIRKRLQ